MAVAVFTSGSALYSLRGFTNNLSQVLQYTSLPWYSSILLLLGISSTAFAEQNAHLQGLPSAHMMTLSSAESYQITPILFLYSLRLGVSSTAFEEQSAHPPGTSICTHNGP